MTDNRYTKWWLALPLEEKDRLRRQAAARAENDLSKIIHRSGQENNHDPAVTAVLEVAARRLLEMATDIECIVAYEIAHRPGGTGQEDPQRDHWEGI